MAQLTSLDLSHCTQVSDKGVLTLVQAQDSSGSPDNRFGQCHKLSRVLVSGCQNISQVSVKVLLTQLRMLSVLDYSDTVGVIHQLILEDKLERQLNLKSLYCGETCSEESLALVTATCPHVEHVYVVLSDNVTCQTLMSLLDIKYLREIHVRDESWSDHGGVTFSEVMSPVLTRHGATLVNINLAEVRHVDIGSICDTCPALVHLALHWNKSYVISNNSAQREWFPAMKTFEASFVNDNENVYWPSEMSRDHLMMLLRSSMLQSVKICHSNNLDDVCMENVYNFSLFQHLQHLELDNCHEITFQCLEVLLEHENSLQSVKLLKCEQITKRDIQNYQRRIQKWKWDLDLVWS